MIDNHRGPEADSQAVHRRAEELDALDATCRSTDAISSPRF